MIDQPVVAVAGFWRQTGETVSSAMVICDPHELVAPIYPKAMIAVLEARDVNTWLCGS